MTDSFHCPKCEQSFRFTPQVAGKTVRCVRCGNVFSAPGGQQPAAAPSPTHVAPLRSEFPAQQPRDRGLDALAMAAAAAASPLAPLGQSRRRGPLLSEIDYVLLGVGAVMAVVAVFCDLILFPMSGGTGLGASILMLFLGVVGAGLIASALRRQVAAAVGAAAGVVALLLVGVILSTRSGNDSPPGPATDSRPASAVAALPQPSASSEPLMTPQVSPSARACEVRSGAWAQPGGTPQMASPWRRRQKVRSTKLTECSCECESSRFRLPTAPWTRHSAA